jgi:hypothetical protein
MLKISMPGEIVERQPFRAKVLPKHESAILSANMRYFGNSADAQAKKNDCEVAIRGALNRYFKVDVA